jgi:DNA repair exonuclease SbcCD ATPase subunit
LKIEYLKLKNFSNIYTAFKSKEISIDLRDCKNRIILFTGPNGSGKTSILSCLHPFATNGNLDIRNDNSLITIGEEGYKEIWLNDDGNEYVIKHFYIPNKESHSVKSYIERNGNELNPNGNVTSFKDIVKTEFDIEMDYLKLTRLGSNVTNFIDLKTTDRKAFMGKILDEVEIYLKYFKKLTNDMRQTKSVISHLIDKIDKLKIFDESEIEKYQDKLYKSIEKYHRDISNMESKLNIINYEIDKYESPLIIKENLDIKKKEKEKIDKILLKSNNDGIALDDVIKTIDKTNDKLTESNSKLLILKDKRTSLLDNLDKLISENDEISNELKKSEELSEIKDIEYIISELRGNIDRRSKENHITTYEYKYTKQDIEKLIVMLDTCMDILVTTYEFGKNPINKAIEYIASGADISDYVANHKNKISKNKLQVYCSYVYEELTKKLGISKPNCKNSSSCKVMEFYNELFDYATETPDEVIEDETFISYTKLANTNINRVIDNIREYKSTFEKLPENIQKTFTLKEILTRISNMEIIYDKDVLYQELSIVTEYELQQEDLKLLKDNKEKLSLLKKSINNNDYFIKRKNTISDDIDNTRCDIDNLSDEIHELKDFIQSTEIELSELYDLQKSLETHDDITSEYTILKQSYETLKELYSNKKIYSDELDRIKYESSKIEKEYNDNDYKLKSFQSLNSELSEYNTIYDEMELTKNSLSSKEGIPLLYIQIYLKSIQDITNELLDIIYNGELFIDDFKITSDEFKIPFTVKNKEIKDVCYASQGERSFISLALSFALIYQSISRYNIMLLDEIDSTLDTSNREKFLQILEKQLAMIDGEQIFLISHNNMFNMYPVDIIDTKNHISNENRLANYIKIKCK